MASAPLDSDAPACLPELRLSATSWCAGAEIDCGVPGLVAVRGALALVGTSEVSALGSATEARLVGVNEVGALAGSAGLAPGVLLAIVATGPPPSPLLVVRPVAATASVLIGAFVDGSAAATPPLPVAASSEVEAVGTLAVCGTAGAMVSPAEAMPSVVVE